MSDSAYDHQDLGCWTKRGRVLALAGDQGPGPDVMVIGGLHGNEPEGLAAGQMVIDELAKAGVALPGRIVLVAGNLGALQTGCRFLDRDLNRGWRAEMIERVRARSTWEMSREDREQLELIAFFKAFLASAKHEVVLVDLHTTSADAPPFSVVTRSEGNIRLARALGLPVILGFDDYVDSPILTWFKDHGCPAIGVEGGGIGDGESAVHLAAALRCVLRALGWPSAGQERLEPELGEVFRIVHRHSVVPGSSFKMEPGFRSFQPVQRGQLLAYDRGGAIRAMTSAQLFMPLYQAQGSDGFFLLRPLA